MLEYHHVSFGAHLADFKKEQHPFLPCTAQTYQKIQALKESPKNPWRHTIWHLYLQEIIIFP